MLIAYEDQPRATAFRGSPMAIERVKAIPRDTVGKPVQMVLKEKLKKQTDVVNSLLNVHAGPAERQYGKKS